MIRISESQSGQIGNGWNRREKAGVPVLLCVSGYEHDPPLLHRQDFERDETCTAAPCEPHPRHPATTSKVMKTKPKASDIFSQVPESNF